MATWTTPTNFAAEEIVTSTKLNEQVIQDLLYLYETLHPVAWSSYAPTVSGWTIGSGTITGFYRQVGKTLDLRGSLTLNSTTTSASALAISLPSGMTAAAQRQAGTAILRDASGGQLYMAFALIASGGSTIVFYETNADNTFVNNSNPFSWTDGDSVEWNLTIEIT